MCVGALTDDRIDRKMTEGLNIPFYERCYVIFDGIVGMHKVGELESNLITTAKGYSLAVNKNK